MKIKKKIRKPRPCFNHGRVVQLLKSEILGLKERNEDLRRGNAQLWAETNDQKDQIQKLRMALGQSSPAGWANPNHEVFTVLKR